MCACARACVRACVRVCVCVCVFMCVCVREIERERERERWGGGGGGGGIAVTDRVRAGYNESSWEVISKAATKQFSWSFLPCSYLMSLFPFYRSPLFFFLFYVYFLGLILSGNEMKILNQKNN